MQASLAGFQGLQGNPRAGDSAQVKVVMQMNHPLPRQLVFVSRATPLLALMLQCGAIAALAQPEHPLNGLLDCFGRRGGGCHRSSSKRSR
ncbi:hypothetical protein D3C79_931640 [compost metagenome]